MKRSCGTALAGALAPSSPATRTTGCTSSMGILPITDESYPSERSQCRTGCLDAGGESQEYATGAGNSLPMALPDRWPGQALEEPEGRAARIRH